MSKLYNQQFSGEPGLVELFFEAPLDAAGAVGTAVRTKGITSVARQSKGNYRVTLTNRYPYFLDVSVLWKKTTVVGVQYQLKAEDVDGAKTIDILFMDQNSPPNVVDPVSCTMLLVVKVKNTTA